MKTSACKARAGQIKLSIVLVLVIFGCLGCCCGRIPLFGLWPDVDERKIAADLQRSPSVADHLCRAEFVCERVTHVEVHRAYPLGWGLVTGNLSVVVDAEVRCEGHWLGTELDEILACAGTIGAIYASAGLATWTLEEVTESPLGFYSTGATREPVESSGGSWDD